MIYHNLPRTNCKGEAGNYFIAAQAQAFKRRPVPGQNEGISPAWAAFGRFRASLPGVPVILVVPAQTGPQHFGAGWTRSLL